MQSLSARMQVAIEQQIADCHRDWTQWPELCTAVRRAHKVGSITTREQESLEATIDAHMRADYGHASKCVNLIYAANAAGKSSTLREVVAAWESWAGALVMQVQQELEVKETK